MKYISCPVDLLKNNTGVYEGITQYDDADIFQIKLMQATEHFALDAYSNIIIEILKPDSQPFVDSIGENLVVTDESLGYLEYTLPSQATEQAGLYFATISIYNEGIKTTTGRFNYYVSDGITQYTDILDESNYPVLTQLISQVSVFAAQEAARVAAEEARVDEYNGIIAATQAIQADINAKYSQMNDLYIAFQEMLADETGTPDLSTLVTTSMLDTALSNVHNTYVAATEPTGMEEGDTYYCTADGKFYIMGAESLAQINAEQLIISATEPTDTSLLWIDTVNNKVKYHDGSSWTETNNTAVFS